MNKFFTLVLTLAALAVAVPVGAQDCVPTTSNPEVDTDETGNGQYYFDLDADGSFWLYEESNGIAGLQRSDEVKDDTCGGLIDADTNVL